MPFTVEDISAHLVALGHEPLTADDAETSAMERGVLLPTRFFKDPGDTRRLLIVVRMLDAGSILEVCSPGLYNVRDCKFKGVVFCVLLEIMLHSHHIQFEYDPESGNLSVSTDLPVLDSTLTTAQVGRLVQSVLHTVERFDSVIRHAVGTGKIDMSLIPAEEPSVEVSAEVAQLIERLGGVDGLRQLVRGKQSDDHS